ncbi:MAG: hypothetical protein L3J69_08675 [Desulfobacula sp.]|nr:hypothetical protein [Desulfobacula sp.]
MKNIYLLIFCFIVLFNSHLFADEFEFSIFEKQFENFVRCELTRTDAFNHFNGEPFKITMIDVFDIQSESDLKIVTGAVQCFVGKTSKKLYVAVGLKTILEKEQVVYYTIRKNDFSILATELLKFPYKERCKWSEYWVDID